MFFKKKKLLLLAEKNASETRLVEAELKVIKQAEKIRALEENLADLEYKLELEQRLTDAVTDLIEPLRDDLFDLTERVLDLEKVSVGSYEAAMERVKAMLDHEGKLKREREYPMIIQVPRKE